MIVSENQNDNDSPIIVGKAAVAEVFAELFTTVELYQTTTGSRSAIRSEVGVIDQQLRAFNIKIRY
jgi:hypothetical protein